MSELILFDYCITPIKIEYRDSNSYLCMHHVICLMSHCHSEQPLKLVYSLLWYIAFRHFYLHEVNNFSEGGFSVRKIYTLHVTKAKIYNTFQV